MKLHWFFFTNVRFFIRTLTFFTQTNTWTKGVWKPLVDADVVCDGGSVTLLKWEVVKTVFQIKSIWQILKADGILIFINQTSDYNSIRLLFVHFCLFFWFSLKFCWLFYCFLFIYLLLSLIISSILIQCLFFLIIWFWSFLFISVCFQNYFAHFCTFYWWFCWSFFAHLCLFCWCFAH